ncbi:hypothetical protein LTR72_010612 [Exophiala xenobiotica]|nr:hypothetical protein LTR72_010612 [Exophiala xenobiotica]KAK5288992.1 hypothetical protein LTR14_007823 [Exophiala xenobiotica]KAK5422439.1 hypothetical protein LTR06_000697 [Exophiala xenobiotica]KAK5473725.1 hypothetical protein LTR55_010260 [Exophiala xenobiotica]
MPSIVEEHSSESTTTEHKRATDDHQHGQFESASQRPKQPGLFKRLCTKAGLDVPTVLMMLKGALPPTIALAAYQSDAWAREYGTLGYLIAIMSIISLPILPRAKFAQNIVTSTTAICLSAAMALLTIRCAVSARGTKPQASATGTSGGKESLAYNSAANATAAVWLFFNLWVANTIRAYRPQLMIVAIQYTIFTVVASTYAPTFPSMTAGIDFVKRLLKIFLTGFALAAGTSYFILPVSSRKICQKQMAGVLNLLNASIRIHTTYLHSISTHQGGVNTDPYGEDGAMKQTADSAASAKHAQEIATKLKTTLQEASKLFGMLRIEISFAKKEIGFGKLRPEDFSAIWTRLQQVLLPVAGLSTFADILESVRRHKAEGENLIEDATILESVRRLEADEWQEVVAMSREPFHRVKENLADGISHIQYVLELVPRPKSAKQDVEKMADASPAPGDPKFAEHLRAEIRLFQQHREGTMRRWCERKGIDVPAKFWEDPSAQYSFKDSEHLDEIVRNKQNHQQLYLILYLEYLLYSVCRSILALVLFADSKVQDGTMSKRRLIFPGWKRTRKLIQHMFTQEDTEPALPDADSTGIIIWPGDSFSRRKDPEHLSPTNWYQRVTDHLRVIPRVLGSDQSAYGFRAAVASLSLAILGFLKPTHHFYLEQRGIWAVIMIAISMGPTAGAGVQGFILRIAGTVAAMVVSITIWYMADQKPAAIIPLSYIAFVCGFYVILKKPKYLITGVIATVTIVLVVGYELQNLKIGTAALTSNGQRFYKVQVLAPYRLGAVVTGLAVAFLWTYLPFPVTTHATLRKDLGATLYLLANYYACTHSTVEMKLRLGAQANDSSSSKNSPMGKLDKARTKCFEKTMSMMNRLREHSNFTTYEPTFGGKFPKQTYDELIAHLQSLFNYMALINFSSEAFVTGTGESAAGQKGGADADVGRQAQAQDESESDSEWLSDFRRLTANARVTSHELTSTLCLVAASMANSQPLPPYVRVPPPIHLADQLAVIDPQILSVQHINEPCYAAFVVLEIASVLIMQETAAVLGKVKELVGEVDFSLHMIESAGASSSGSMNGLGKGKAD